MEYVSYMKSIFIYTSSCERRKLDASRLQRYLTRNNYKIVYHPKKADIIVFFACAVLDRPTMISLKEVRRFQKYPGELVVGGCLPAIEPSRLREIFDGQTFITEDLDKNPQKIDQIFGGEKIFFERIEDGNLLFRNIDERKINGMIMSAINDGEILKELYLRMKTYILKKILGEQLILYRFILRGYSYQIRTSWGCHGRCAYCSINKAVGAVKSKKIESCIKEFKIGIKKGYKHFVITGDNVGAYGTDIGTNLPKLLHKITNIQGDYDIAVLNLHPRWVVLYIDQLEKILSNKKITSIDIPFQSGSKRILKLMNRYPEIQKIKDVCKKLKEVNPNLLLGTDIIIGFPSETFQEFKETLDFIKEAGFDLGTAIKFSSKKGTKAEHIQPKISNKEINRRFNFARKDLTKAGFKTIHTPKLHYFVFDKKA